MNFLNNMLVVLGVVLILSVSGCEETRSTTAPVSGYQSSNTQNTGDENNNIVEQTEDKVEEPEVPVVKLKVGDRVIVQNVNPDGLRIRLQASVEAQIIGGVWDGQTGKIIGAPVPGQPVDNRFTWWNINWNNGEGGWSAEAGLDGTVYIVKKP